MTLERMLEAPPSLEGKGVVLRAWEPEDATWYVESRDGEVYRWTSERPELTVDQAKRAIEEHRARRGHVGFAIADIETNSLLGNLALVIDKDGERGEISFWLAPSARGRGVATAAVNLLTQWAFASLPQLGRIELHILSGNVASQRVAERAGFVQTAVISKEIKGQLTEAFVYSRKQE